MLNHLASYYEVGVSIRKTNASCICLDRVNLRAKESKCLATAVDRSYLEPPHESISNRAVSTPDIKDCYDVSGNTTQDPFGLVNNERVMLK